MLLSGFRYRVFIFENMTEEVGREIGNKVGQTIEVDKWSWQDGQAKFMRIKIDLPIDKPLRRGGHIANVEVERSWVTFKYERLPTFCFICGIIGYDNKHCLVNPNWQHANLQYGEWLRAGSANKGGTNRIRPQ